MQRDRPLPSLKHKLRKGKGERGKSRSLYRLPFSLLLQEVYCGVLSLGRLIQVNGLDDFSDITDATASGERRRFEAIALWASVLRAIAFDNIPALESLTP
jgi:hypothetical protein